MPFHVRENSMGQALLTYETNSGPSEIPSAPHLHEFHEVKIEELIVAKEGTVDRRREKLVLQD